MTDRRFVKPKDQPVISRKVANQIREVANNTRKGGTPNDMTIVKTADEFVEGCTGHRRELKAHQMKDRLRHLARRPWRSVWWPAGALQLRPGLVHQHYGLAQ